MKKQTVLLMLLSFLAGIGVSAIFFHFHVVPIQYEYRIKMPDSSFEDDLIQYFTGESREEMDRRTDEMKKNAAKEHGYETWEEWIKSNVEKRVSEINDLYDRNKKNKND